MVGDELVVASRDMGPVGAELGHGVVRGSKSASDGSGGNSQLAKGRHFYDERKTVPKTGRGEPMVDNDPMLPVFIRLYNEMAAIGVDQAPRSFPNSTAIRSTDVQDEHFLLTVIHAVLRRKCAGLNSESR